MLNAMDIVPLKKFMTHIIMTAMERVPHNQDLAMENV